MHRIDNSLITPIYAKTDAEMAWPSDPVFYLLAGNDLYLCRNNQHYRSCVAARRWPTELAHHRPSLQASFPQIPRQLMQQVCGFFGHMSDRHAAEAIVLLAWDGEARRIRPIVPRQVAAVTSGGPESAYPIGVKYRFPRNLPRGWTVYCDLHSHCEMAAYASQQDRDDEHSFAGLHIVVGRLHQEPPHFHAEAVVDGTRFHVPPCDVIDYVRREPFPDKWLKQIRVTDYDTFRHFDFDAEQIST